MAQHKNTPAEPTEIMALEEYDAIESAVMETARGRWFLTEFAQRHRVADTETLLNAIAKLDNSIGEKADRAVSASTAASTWHEGNQDIASKAMVQKIRMAVSDLSAAIQLTRQEIDEVATKQIADGRCEPGIQDLSEISSQAEQATSAILVAAEAIQASASSLRERDVNPDICEALDQHAIEIYAACTIQDVSTQRISKLISLVGFLEDEVHSILNLWEPGDAGADLESSPVPEDGEFNGAEADARPSDVFEVVADAAANNDPEPDVDADHGEHETPDDDDAGTSRASATMDPFAGQDAFESNADILKWANKS
uniref:hypothetical protein n=1 Tax=Pararhizobium sp. IMCC3301 TaxID=3067904 RepID=UPI0027425D69|nr:hypothetical protein [Pararhizobium sp. IMCC3301]